jgi:Lon protease-like protein
MAIEKTTFDPNRAYPVFPLHEAVLFPYAMLPLLIHEPRYRRMTRDALDSFGIIAIAHYNAEVSESESLYGRPDLAETVGIGQVIDYEHLSDDRYILTLYGLCRARIKIESEHHPYRMAYLQPIDVGRGDETTLREYRQTIEVTLYGALSKLGYAEKAKDNHISSQIPTKVLIDQIINAVCRDTDERYKLLSETNVTRRANWLIHYLKAAAGE